MKTSKGPITFLLHFSGGAAWLEKTASGVERVRWASSAL